MTRQEIIEQKNIAQREILEAEAHLASTDYIAAKLAEGKATKTEYKEEIDARQGCRDAINAAKACIAELDAMTPDDDEEPAIYRRSRAPASGPVNPKRRTDVVSRQSFLYIGARLILRTSSCWRLYH